MSLRLTTDKRVIQHLVAFALAWVAAASLFAYVLRPITVALPTPSYSIMVLGKGDLATKNLLYLASAMRGGQTIVMLGSSELEKAFIGGPYVPESFFPIHLIAPVLTYGKRGFETLGMYGLLSALRVHLNPNTRLVVLLSPAWFYNTNLQPAAFDENFNESVLLQLYEDDDPRGVIHDYLTAHQGDFTSMTSAQRLFLDDPSSTVNWNLPMFVARIINSRAYTQREKLEIRLAELHQADHANEFGAIQSQSLPWDNYKRVASMREKKRMTNNDLWVRNVFYDSYLRRASLTSSNYFPADMNPEPEMDSLKLLLQLLNRNKVSALVVMLPVNARMYHDLGRFNPVDERIANLCREYGMKYMDMYRQTPEIGVLRDGIHPGDVGWLMIDREIAEHFHL